MHTQSGRSYPGLLADFARLKLTRGFSLAEYHDHELDRFPKEYREAFLNLKEQRRLLALLNPRKYYILARNKYLTHLVLEAQGIRRKAPLYCYYDPEARSCCEGRVAYDTPTTLRALREAGVKSCVVKTTESSHGENVWVIREVRYREQDATLIRFDGTEISLSELLGQEPLLFEGVVRQTEQLARFCPSSVNTVRFMTTLYPSGEARIVASFIKIGRIGRCVDNAGDGGNVDASIDVESGRIVHAIRYDGWRRLTPIERHPDTEAQLEGVVIRNWEAAKAEVLRFQQAFPFVKAAGWDIALTDEGPLVIEVNDFWDRTGQLFIRKGWKPDMEDCYEAWRRYYRRNH